MPEGNNQHPEGPLSDINVTPLVDVMLVLLIIFMVTAPMLTMGVHVNLPRTAAGPLEAQKPPIIVSITQRGEIYVDDRRIDPAALDAEIDRAVKLGHLAPVYLKADREVPYGIVVQVMGRLKAAGVEKLGMVTESATKKPEEQSNR